MTNPEETKDKFYEELDSLIASAKSEKLIILAITNTMFRLPTRNKTSWMRPRSKHWHLIDYVIIRAKDRWDVRVTKAMCSADCWTDHRLIISKMNFHIQPKRRPQGQKVTKKLNVMKLKDPKKVQEFQDHMHSRLSDLQLNQPSIEDEWASFMDTAHSAALECLGPNDPTCMAKKAAFTNIRSVIQAKLCHMQDFWLSVKTDEIQCFADSADRHDTKRILQKASDPSPSSSSTERRIKLTFPDLSRSYRDQIHSEENREQTTTLQLIHSNKMERALILLISTLMIFVVPSQADSHLSFDSTIEVNITRTGCGKTKQCLESPDNCDPAENTTCLFASIEDSTMASNDTGLYFELSGKSNGYIAVGLTENTTQGTTMLFVCAQNSSANGMFFFRTVRQNNTNGMLTSVMTNVTQIRYKVNDTLIQCEFNVPSLNVARTRRVTTNYTVVLGSGELNGDSLGNFSIVVKFDPNMVTPTPTTSVTMTTSGANGALHPHAVTVLLSVLTLSVLKTT
ncbi:uncharacterized protein KZ484_021202 [Pholidichthys leucotaenia]